MQVTNHQSLGAARQGREPQAAMGSSPGQLKPQWVCSCPLLMSLWTAPVCVCPPQREGLGMSKEGKEQSSSGEIPALLQPKASPAPWSHILLGTKGRGAAPAAQHNVGLHCSSGPQLLSQPSSPWDTHSLLLCHTRVCSSLTHPRRGWRRHMDSTCKYLIHTLGALSQPQ